MGNLMNRSAMHNTRSTASPLRETNTGRMFVLLAAGFNLLLVAELNISEFFNFRNTNEESWRQIALTIIFPRKFAQNMGSKVGSILSVHSTPFCRCSTSILTILNTHSE